MSYDIYADFWDREKGVNFNELEKKIPEPLVRVKLLKLSKKETNAKRKHAEWIKNMDFSEKRRLITNLGILPDILQIKDQKYSSLIRIVFSLKKPYISQDDENFYILDNPVCKDKVFKVPLVRASSWKGALRWVAYKQYVDKLETVKIRSENWKEVRGKLVRLFGDEKDDVDSWLNQVIADRLKKNRAEIEKGFEEYLRDRGYVGESGNRKGRLVFYPSFFGRIGLDVITPHDRKTKTPAKGPIYFETVPERTKGTFYLLYFPFGLLGKEGTEVEEEIKQDLAILKEAIPVMLTKYGFGAKTTAGYGVVENEIIFQILPGIEEEKEDEQFGKEGSAFLKELDGLINRKEER